MQHRETTKPAMNDTTGFFVPLFLMKSAASSSAVPPISPIMMMPSVCNGRAINTLCTPQPLRCALVPEAFNT